MLYPAKRIHTGNTHGKLWVLAIAALVMVLPAPRSAHAGRFFAKTSTWYTRIPEGHPLAANSSEHVSDILQNGKTLALNYGEYSVPVYYAPPDAERSQIAMPGKTSLQKAYAQRQGWDYVPVPVNALPAGNVKSCAGHYRDGHMVVISADRRFEWDFYGAKFCNDAWSASVIRKWDLTGDGINSPYDLLGTVRLAPVPLTHGLLMYDEVAHGRIDHALAFAYHADKYLPPGGYTGVYPAEISVMGSSMRQWGLRVGMRLQLDPSVECDALNLKPAGKKICRALQEYGMIFVENSGPGSNDLYAEANRDWWGLAGDLSAIPLAKFRVVEPVYPESFRKTQPGNSAERVSEQRQELIHRLRLREEPVLPKPE